MTKNIRSSDSDDSVAIIECDDQSEVLKIAEDDDIAFSDKDRDHQQISSEPDIKAEKNWVFDGFDAVDGSELVLQIEDVNNSEPQIQSVKTGTKEEEEGETGGVSAENPQIIPSDNARASIEPECKPDDPGETAVVLTETSQTSCARCAYFMGENNILKRQLEETKEKLERVNRRDRDRSKITHSRDKQPDKIPEVKGREKHDDRRKRGHSTDETRGRKRKSPSPGKERGRHISTAHSPVRYPENKSLRGEGRSNIRNISRAYAPKVAYPLSPIRSPGRLEQQGNWRPRYRTNVTSYANPTKRVPNPPVISASPWSLPSVNLMPHQQQVSGLPYSLYVGNAPLLRERGARGSQGSGDLYGQLMGSEQIINQEYAYLNMGLAGTPEDANVCTGNTSSWSSTAANRGTSGSAVRSIGGSGGYEKNQQQWMNSSKDRYY